MKNEAVEAVKVKAVKVEADKANALVQEEATIVKDILALEIKNLFTKKVIINNRTKASEFVASKDFGNLIYELAMTNRFVRTKNITIAEKINPIRRKFYINCRDKNLNELLKIMNIDKILEILNVHNRNQEFISILEDIYEILIEKK